LRRAAGDVLTLFIFFITSTLEASRKRSYQVDMVCWPHTQPLRFEQLDRAAKVRVSFAWVVLSLLRAVSILIFA
jgi:hypothetical protein